MATPAWHGGARHRGEEGEGGRLRKAAIARSFDAAAPRYDVHAGLQRAVAGRLAERIARLDPPPPPRVLEIGCGTGFVSEALLARLPAARCLLTDLSPAMVRRCRDKLGHHPGAAGFVVMDGEAPAVAGGFDLVASSLAVQWFLDPQRALARLGDCLAPGGRLVFATLGADTFSEWRAAHEALGLAYGATPLSTAATLGRLLGCGGGEGPGALRGTLEEERVLRRYPGPGAFLHELRGLGADLPAGDHRPLAAGSMRKLLRHLEGAGSGGFTVTYQVLYGCARKAAAAGEAPRYRRAGTRAASPSLP